MATDEPPTHEVVVSRVTRFEPPLDRPPAELLRGERGLSVELEDGRRIPLDPQDPRSVGFVQILEGLRTQGLPVYLELDPATSGVRRLFIARVTRILHMRPIDTGVLGIELERSHGRHVLRSDRPNFAELEQDVREAWRSRDPVIVTEDDAHTIIDVRPFRPGPDGPRPPVPEPKPGPSIGSPVHWIRRIRDVIVRWFWWPWWWFRCVSPKKAQQVFNAMQATTCDPLTVPAPCIPFLYPDDGCWGRAHEMCRRMITMGLSPRKVWIQGNLYVGTKNNPNCGVWWGWHVAPTLCVRSRGLFQAQRMVIDPSLFTTPVSQATWKSVQSDPNATLTDTDAAIFWLWGSGTDLTYSETKQVLADHRLLLQARSVQQGPPPYANCP
jgi:hypothetical protein